MKKLTMFIFFMVSLSVAISAQFKQTVRGTVIDKVTTSPIAGVTVIVNDGVGKLIAYTNSLGVFTIKEVPVGRNNFTFYYMGYETLYLRNISVNSGKELFLNVDMTENVTLLGEVTVRGYKKGEVINQMAAISARSFSVEETERYAGSWADPGRMATNFAGVLTSSNDTRNDIIIRGNSPAGLLWRLEGIDIPNPNHFAVQGTSGGPVSMLNSNMLTRSDFMSGAFPAQYGNALAGVFDLNLRNGNNNKHEYVLQAGLNGYEAGVEGPFSKQHNSSYMFNWRYSFLDLLQKMGFNIAGGAIPTYTDLNFKIYAPTKRAGTFSLFGLGGIDKVSAGAENSTDQFNPIKNTDLRNNTKIGVVGLTNKLILGEKANLITALSYSAQNSHIELDSIMSNNTKQLYYSSFFFEQQLLVSMHYTRKVNSRNTLSAGFIYKDKWIKQHDSVFYYGSYLHLLDLNNEHLRLIQGFMEWKHRFSDKTDLYIGVHSQYLLMNDTKTIEPRIGFKWNITKSQSLNFGYGIHSQAQTLPVYFIESSNAQRTAYWRTCENLDFSKSQHFVVGYNNKLSENWNLKIEAYYQDMWDIPVETRPTNFSVLNLGSTYYNGTEDKDSLVNNGLGKNYGLEMTLEKYLSHNWYLLTTGSLFNSRYKPSDGIWRNTKYASNYALNFLLGVEYPFNSKLSIDFNFRVVWSGGIRSLEIDKEASVASGKIVYLDYAAYSKRNKDYIKADTKITLKYNMRGSTLECGIDLINVTDRNNIYSESFNPATGVTSYTYQQGFLPTAMIRIVF